MSSSLTFTMDEIPTHFSTAWQYLSRSPITEGRILGSKTIGANSPTPTAHVYKTDAAGSITVTNVPICRTDGLSLSGSGSHEESKSNVAVPSIKNS